MNVVNHSEPRFRDGRRQLVQCGSEFLIVLYFLIVERKVRSRLPH